MFLVAWFVYLAATLTGSLLQFSIDTEDIAEFRNDLHTWRTGHCFDNPFPPMIIETYLDASQLSPSQCLVVEDDNGKRWDVLEALNTSASSGDSPTLRARHTEVILERWRFELDPLPKEEVEEFSLILPTIYKKAIVFFRSLFTAVRLWPAYKFSQQSMTKRRQPALEVKFRVLTEETDRAGFDPLRQPLSDARDVVTDYSFGNLPIPVGRFSASVTYRNECHFRLVDAESLLSSRFMGIDENFFKPSVPPAKGHTRRESSAEAGSVPSRRQRRELEDASQAYGSLSTFHGAGALGTSPISALKSIKPMGSDTTSPAGSVPASMEEGGHSLPIRPSFRGKDAPGRRSSISFQAFKSGSLSGSPRVHDGEVPASPLPGQRQSGLDALTQARNRNSLTAGMPASLRGGPAAATDIPMSSSPRPGGSRISSSFSHRRGRSSYGGQSRGGEDDQTSSGRQSLSSSIAQPGSGMLAETGGQASSGSLTADDDNISEFLKLLDSKKTLQSFETGGKKGESASKRTVTQLSKFQLMRESNNALTESMTTSVQLNRTSSSPGRQLTSVPGMVAPASMSISSSPGKPLSPHTPHTPAIPSRLSENSIIDYETQAQVARRVPRTAPQIASTEEEPGAETPMSPEGTTAIDIPLPLSPRLMQNNRRSSSVAQQQRSLAAVEDDADLAFGSRRSISLGTERDPPTMSGLLALEAAETGGDASGLQPAAHIRATTATGAPLLTNRENANKEILLTGTSSDGAPRSRYKSTRGRPTPPQSSRGSFVGSSSGRYGAGRGDADADDEPLVFDMQVSELGRRSLEEGRGGGSTGSSSNERGFGPRGVSRRGW